jgi:N-acetyl-1-D-myo-inositol-2-amino-2-deoxy-alpha-D-glucopyranoside deacetylase
MPAAGGRLLLVHAHPDDETINNGATMAYYAAAGASVTLVTCTRGELGEVIPAELAHLAADVAGDGGRALGVHREAELAAAMSALGVTDHRFLGAPGTVHRDSGMAYTGDGGVGPVPDPLPGAFALAPLDEPAGELAALIRELRPHVVVTYEPGGGYGHPDHVMAHRVTMRAVELAEPDWSVPKVYWDVLPESLMRAALRLLEDAPDALPEAQAGWDPDGRLPSMVVPDEQVTTSVDATAFTAAKVAAMRAHATQATVEESGGLATMALSNGVRRPLVGLEFYRLVRGTPAPPFDDAGRETDLFAGL